MTTIAPDHATAVAREAIASFRESLAAYRAGNLMAEKFKAIRLNLGVYSQRQTGRYMLRTKVPAGSLAASSLTGLADAADRFSGGKVHLTTRQDIQFYDVTEERLADLLATLADAGIVSLGAGGNTLRNVVLCTGHDRTEGAVFDLSGIATALSHRFLGEKRAAGLPRKFKVTFCGCPAGCAGAHTDDLAFIAVDGPDGRLAGFQVRVGGGQGAVPRMAKKLEELVTVGQVPQVVEGLLALFNEKGNRLNRNRSRIKFLVERVGMPRFTEWYRAEKERNGGVAPLDAALPAVRSGVDRLVATVPTGDLTSEQLREIALLLASHPGVSLRVTRSADLAFDGLTDSTFGGIRESLGRLGLAAGRPGVRPTLLSCNGATTCSEGIANSKGLASRLERLVFGRGGFPLTVAVSGCPNACGHHHTADIGLQGSARKVDGALVPHYQLFIGGSTAGEGRFAVPVVKLPARRVVEAVAELLAVIDRERDGDETVASLAARLGAERFERALLPYTTLPPRAESPDAYLDWDADTPFSLDEVGPGECGGAALDLIDGYFDQARHALAEANGNDDPAVTAERSRTAAMLAAKALLVTHGVDPESDEEAVREFDKKIFQRGFVPEELRGILAGPLPLDPASDAQRFLTECLAAYTRINAQANLVDEGEEAPAAERLDLAGVACPFNYVKVKLALEGVASGSRLEVLLDDGSPIRNVPKSLTNDGHRIVSHEPFDGRHLLVVEKG